MSDKIRDFQFVVIFITSYGSNKSYRTTFDTITKLKINGMKNYLEFNLCNLNCHAQIGRNVFLQNPCEATASLPGYAVDSFRYTLDNPTLTPEQRRFYEKNGFLVIKNLVSSENLRQYE